MQSSPRFYGIPKINKVGTPLRPIVSSRGPITYGVAKELAYIIKPLVSQSPYHLKKHLTFCTTTTGQKLESGEVITSFEMKALFTSVPILPAIQIVKQRLQQDTTLPQRTNMPMPQITSLLQFCLTNTYFLFHGKYYEQVQGAAMGSPISPLIANIFMEEFEVKALSSTPFLWLRFVDDTFVINRAEHSQALLQHIQQPGPMHTVHSGTNTTRLTPIPRHFSHHRTGQHIQHFSPTRNQPTQTNIYTGTATTTSLPNKVYSTH